MSEPLWTVSEHLVNVIPSGTPLVGGTLSKSDRADDDQKKSLYEYWLCFDGRKAHVLTGERGKLILEDFADELNAKNYAPKFIKGRMIMEMSPAQRTKLALLQSPPLPL